MSKSNNAEFDFLEAAQSHKHLTVNDALVRLDAISQLVLISNSQDLPMVANDGDCYAVQANDPFFGDHGGKVALFDNGGYTFLPPKVGWRAYVADSGDHRIFDGSQWRNLSSTEGGLKVLKFDQTLSGSSVSSDVALPEKTSVIGVTARVIEEITGPSLSSWSLGVAGSLDRYGSGLWLGVNGWVRGLTGTPMTYWSDEPLTVTPDNGAFTAGKVRIYIHYMELALPPEV